MAAEESIRIILEAANTATAELNKVVAGIQKLNDSNTKSQGVFARLNKVADEHAHVLLSIQVASAAAVAEMTHLISHAITTASALGKLSRQTGISVEDVSRLSVAARLLGLDVSDLQQAFRFLQKAQVEATQPGSAAAAAFEVLGITVTEANGNLKDSKKLLFEVADAFKKLTNAQLKNTLALALTGRGGTEFIGFLSQGSEGLKQFGAEAEKFGLIVSGDTVQHSREFTRNLTRLQLAAEGLGEQLAHVLLPSLIAITHAMVENKAITLALGFAFSSIVVVIGTAFTAIKALSIAGEVAGAILGVEVVAGARGALAVIAQLGRVALTGLISSLGLAGVAVASLTALVFAAIEGFKLLEARKQAAAAQQSLITSQDALNARLESQIALTQKAGQITEIEAARMRRALTAAFNTKDADLRLRVIKDISKELRKAQGIETETGKPGAPVRSSIENPEVAKARAAGLASIQKAANDLSIAQDKATLDLFEINLNESLSRRLISQTEFEKQKLELVKRRIALEENAVDIASNQEISTIVNQLAVVQGRLNALTAEQKISDPTLQTSLLTEQATLNAAKEVAEKTHQQKLVEIHASAGAQIQAQDKARAEAEQAMREKNLAAAGEIFGNLSEISQAFGKKGFIAAKAFAIGQAVINTALAITKTLADPLLFFPTNVILAGTIAALGAVQIAKIASTGFAEGGLVPGSPSSRDNRLANVATGEYIFDAASVQRAGPAWFANLHAALRDGSFTGFARGGIVPRPVTTSSFAGGGLVGQADRRVDEAQQTANVNLGFLDSRNQQREFMRREGVRYVIDMMQRRGNKVFA